VLSWSARLLSEVMRFGVFGVDSLRIPLDGRRVDVHELLARCERLAYANHVRSGLGGSTPLPVVPERIALPRSAGVVDPADHLRGPHLEEYLRHATELLPEDEWGHLPRACHQVRVGDEDRLARMLLKANLCAAIPESSVPRSQRGRLILGGLFAVPKNTYQDRLIYDRRVPNLVETPLDWIWLPSGAGLSRARLRPDEWLRGSGDDLEC